MKIDFEMLEKLEAAGASAKVIIEFLRPVFEKHEQRKSADRVRKANGKTRKVAERVRKPTETQRNEATLEDTPKARLFREGVAALETLGITGGRTRSLIASWLKLTNEDVQLVLATILKAQELNVVEAPGWIMETLKGKRNGHRNGAAKGSLAAVADDLIARAESAEREAGFGDFDESFSGVQSR